MSSSRDNRVKNRAPAAIQITAEQIVVESRERSMEDAPSAPRRHVVDAAELADHRARARKEFEDHLRRQRYALATWLRYASWEAGQGELIRARSVFERALEVDFKHVPTWIRYAEVETRARFVNRARNVLDRAIGLLPRVDALWLRAVSLEETIGDTARARILFERWTTWEPPENAWLAFARFEERAGERARARAVHERLCAALPSSAAFIRYAKWEYKGGQSAFARRVYETGARVLTASERDAAFYTAFATFEASVGEIARARAILSAALSACPQTGSARDAASAALLAHDKTHGTTVAVEEALLDARRVKYQTALDIRATDYDAAWDWVRLEEAAAEGGISSKGGGGGGGASGGISEIAATRVRNAYQRATEGVPPVPEKRFWRRYIYLFLSWAAWEELSAKDAARARSVLHTALRLVPHQKFTFGKLWLAAAQAELRALDVNAARRLLGAALGYCPKASILNGYMALEAALGDFDRVRKLAERGIALAPDSAIAWCRLAELEMSVAETDRARAVFELAISQESIDAPEIIWKTFIGEFVCFSQLTIYLN
jgi:crooked neck